MPSVLFDIINTVLSCRSVSSNACRLEMPKDELPNHNCIKHLRSVVQQQQTKISELEKTVAEHKHQLGEQVRKIACSLLALRYFFFP